MRIYPDDHKHACHHASDIKDKAEGSVKYHLVYPLYDLKDLHPSYA